ncbi:MAG: hypothetical protein HY657_01425 [Acidobacteria bacterium]|nr:hypothetical protein [Acidobacteriota bacterium]
MRSLRGLVPSRVRRAVSVRLALRLSRRVSDELAALAASRRPIVVGPWLGEVGYELLYWIPFLAWFSERFEVDPSRLVVLSRGGTASWYAPFAGHYRDVLDYVSPEAYRAHHDARVREVGEQKQTRITAFDRQVVARAAADAGLDGAGLLHPSTMYRVLQPFWWGHLDESWVHRHTRYRRHAAADRAELPQLPASYCAVKFYFNDCFPATEANRAFVRGVVARLAREGPVVSLSAGAVLDDHGACSVAGHGVLDLARVGPPARNLHVQSAIVAHARAFVGTYGGFAYLAPFYGVPSTGYFDDASGFAPSHLRMARSAFASIGAGDLLDVRSVSDIDGSR